MIKVYKKDRNVSHNVIYGMLIFLTVAILAAWIYKGVFPVQAVAGYGLVLSYAVMLRSNQTYIELDDEELRVINVKDSGSNKNFLLGSIESISIRRAGIEGYSLEIKVGNRITSCTATLVGKTEKNALVKDLLNKGIPINN